MEKPDDILLSQSPFKEGGDESFSVPYVFEHSVWPEYRDHMEKMEINKAADTAWAALSRLDAYIQDYQPFKLIKTEPERTRAVIWGLLTGLASVSWMLRPFMPATAEKIMDALSISKEKPDDWRRFVLRPMENLFPRKE